MPSDPWAALECATQAHTRLTCTIIGVENKQGNREVSAKWQIEVKPMPVLRPVANEVLRPNTANEMQQVRAEVASPNVVAFEYFFDRETSKWNPEYADEPSVHPKNIRSPGALKEAQGNRNPNYGWRLVKNLLPMDGTGFEKDHAALALVKPESGSFLLVSLRRRKKNIDGRNKES
jgi:hypothetical protein